MAKLTFRGETLRGGNWSITEGGIVHRLKFLGDLSITAARGLGIEDIFYIEGSLRDFHEDFNVSGTRNITDCTVQANGMPAQSIAISATLLEYEAYTKMGKEEDDPAEARIRLTITTTSPFREIENYGNTAGGTDAVLKVTLAGSKQGKMFGPEEPAAEAEVEEGPTLASSREVNGRKRKGQRPVAEPEGELASVE